jgi:hypothetical protein
MRFWVDIYNAAGERQGSGPIKVISATVKRKLDGAGSISFNVPGTDRRSLQLIQNERRARVWAEEAGVMREVGRGIIQRQSVQDNPRSWTFRVDGADSLDELRRINTLLGRKWSNTLTSTIVSQLVALVPNWTATIESLTTYSTARFDGASVLLALQKIAEQSGLHLRLGEGNELEFGAFGVSNGLTITNIRSARPELTLATNRLFVEYLSLVTDTEETVNWLLPLGAGEGEAALTLALSDRTSPYTKTAVALPDGRTGYALIDQASVDEYGLIQRIGKFDEVAPITNGATDQVNASNALYDYAANWLSRAAVKQETFNLKVRKPAANIKPGDLVHVRYIGMIHQDGRPVTYREIDADYWVMEVTETLTKGGASVALQISNVDRRVSDEASIVLGAIEKLELRTVSVQPYYVLAPYTFVRDMDSTHTATVPIVITNAVQRLERVLLRVRSAPFRSNAKTPAHRHRVAIHSGSTTIVNGSVGDNYTFAGNGSGSISVAGAMQRVGTPGDLYTYDAAGAQEYGIYDDTSYPASISVTIDGVDRTTALGGPWGTISTAMDETLVITDYLDTPLEGEHTVEFSCASGRGTVEVVTELYMLVQSIAAMAL